MKIVLAEVPYTKDRDISVEKSCVPEGAELTMAVFDEHAENKYREQTHQRHFRAEPSPRHDKKLRIHHRRRRKKRYQRHNAHPRRVKRQQYGHRSVCAKR